MAAEGILRAALAVVGGSGVPTVAKAAAARGHGTSRSAKRRRARAEKKGAEGKKDVTLKLDPLSLSGLQL